MRKHGYPITGNSFIIKRHADKRLACDKAFLIPGYQTTQFSYRLDYMPHKTCRQIRNVYDPLSRRLTHRILNNYSQSNLTADFMILGSLSKPRRRRQRERHQTKDLMSKTMAEHVRYKSLYNSLPSSAKQQREMTKFCVVYGTWTTTAIFSYFDLELKTVVAYLA